MNNSTSKGALLFLRIYTPTFRAHNYQNAFGVADSVYTARILINKRPNFCLFFFSRKTVSSI